MALFGQNTSTLWNHDMYFALFNFFTLLGDTGSRKFAYWFQSWLDKDVNPLLFLVLSATGVLLCLIKVPFVAPLGIFCVFFANGAIYATTTKFIDMHVPHKYNLISLSFWLFVGDFGSVTGSNTWQSIQPLVCDGVTAAYFCVVSNSTR